MIQNALLLGAAIPSTLLNGLLGYWKLDGNANDALGANNGTIVGSGSWSTGIIGNAYLSAAASYINLGDSAVLKPQSAITVAAWFYFTAIQGANLRAVCDWHQNGGQDRWILGYSPDGQTMIFHAFGINDTLGVIGSTISLNTWVHLAGTWSQATGQKVAYRNGAAVSTTPGLTGSLVAGSAGFPLCLGQQYNSGAPVTGKVDEFGIWNRALLASEVADLYNSGAGKSHPF